MSLIRLSLRKKRFVSAPPGTGAMAMPQGAVNGHGTAADFYDSVGVNVKGLNGQMGGATIISKVANLGVRHIRDGAIPSWNTFWASGAGGRQLWVRLRQRNRALPTPTSTDQGHPVFLGTIVDPWGPLLPSAVEQMYLANPLSTAQGLPYRICRGRDYTVAGIMQFFGGGHQHYNGNAGPQATYPYIGDPIPNTTTTDVNAFVPNPWNFNDPECPWEIVGMFGGPNEPNAPPAGVRVTPSDPYPYGPQSSEISQWMGDLKRAKDAQVGQGYGRAGVTLSGNGRIVTETGLVTTAPTISQIPLVGYVVMNIFWVYNDPGSGESAQKDMSKGGANPVDAGDMHQYQYAEEPTDSRMRGVNGSGEIGYTNDAHSYFVGHHDPYNGSQFPTPSASRNRDPARAVPMVHSEWAMCDRSDPPTNYASTRFAIGQWASPRDVNAEYTVRQLLLAWGGITGEPVRRTYIYQLQDMANDPNPEYNLGLHDFNGTIKPAGLAVRNLLKLVGFSEPTQNGRLKLNLTVSGYPTGQFNDHFGTAVEGVAPVNVVVHRNIKKLHAIQIQQDDDTWLLALVPQVTLWDQVPGNRNAGDTGWASLGNPTLGRKSPSTSTVTVTLPNDVNISTAEVAWPCRNLAPNGASYTWTTPDDGLTWDNLTITANQISVGIDRYTKIVKLTRVNTPTTLPIVVPSVGSTPAALRIGSTNGPRLHLKGMNVWGLPDDITNNVSISGTAFHQHQYAARTTVCDTISDWGGNCIRLRAQASDYNGAPSAATDSLTKTQILDRVEDWRDACQVEGMYLVICPWDGLDGPYSGSAFPAQYTNTFQFYTDVFGRLGNDPMVMYETPNEPNNISMAQWQTVMQGYLTHFRDTLGYTGVVVLDPPNWANSGGSTSPTGNPAGYSDSAYSALEAFDAARTGMGGKHQLVFAKHDYANNTGYAGTFSQTNWVNGMGGTDIKHLIWANEFGNYNAGGPDPDTVAQWSVDYAVAARDRFAAKTNYVGAAPFLFGPWSDANAITATNNVTPTSPWGDTVEDYYFGTSNPPPASLLQPGMVFNADLGAADAGVILGADVMRVEFIYGTAVGAMEATFDYYADRGIRILLLAGGGVSPTQADAENMGNWAQHFGPGGDFWVARGTDGELAVQHIEWGNEISYSYRSGTRGSPGYVAIAANYATRFQQAYNDITATGKNVGLLCIADADGSDNASWVNTLFNTVPSIASLVAARGGGWTCHTYGPTYPTRLATTASAVANRGAPASIPIDVTEIGVSTDNGRALSDNYGWPVNLTYAQAATTLGNQVTAMRSGPQGSRIRHLMVYQTRDQAATGAITGREGYFGGLQNNLAAKGVYTTQVQTILNL